MSQYFIDRDVFEASAILIGERFDLRALENADVLDTSTNLISGIDSSGLDYRQTFTRK